jgi:hypothetical protein
MFLLGVCISRIPFFTPKLASIVMVIYLTLRRNLLVFQFLVYIL